MVVASLEIEIVARYEAVYLKHKKDTKRLVGNATSLFTLS